MRALLLLGLGVAVAGCEGSPVVVDLAAHDAQAENVPELGGDAAADGAPTRDARADASDPPDGAERGGEASSDAGADMIDAGAEDSASDSLPPYPCDAASCSLADGATCQNVSVYGCGRSPNDQAACGSNLLSYRCSAPPMAGCYVVPPQNVIYCCDPSLVCPS